MIKADFQEMEDHDLMQYLMKEDPLAWSEIINRYGGLVYSIAYQILKNQSDAEDASQNTFIRLKIYCGNFKEDSTLKPWLSKIASGEAIRIYNQKKSISKKESQRMTANDISNNDITDSALENLEQKELEVLVKKALDLLPETPRVAVTLYYVGGLTQKEIAKELGLSQFSISEKINFGLEKIRAYLKKSGIQTAIILSPNLIQDSLLTQVIPTTLAKKINSSVALQQSIIKPGTSLVGPQKSIFHLSNIKYYAFFVSVFLGLVLCIIHFNSSKPIEVFSFNEPSKISTTIDKTEKVYAFESVDYRMNIPVGLIFQTKTDENANLEDLNGEKFLILQKSNNKWKLFSDKNNNPSILRLSKAENEDLRKRDFDGFYFNKLHKTPQVYHGEIKINGQEDIAALFVSTAKDGKVFDNLAWPDSLEENFSRQINSKTELVRVVKATKSIIIYFLIFVYPKNGKLVSTSLVTSNGNTFINFRSVQMETTTNNFYFGVISNGDVEISKFKTCDLGENWEYQKEEELIRASENYQGDLWKDMVQSTTQFTFNKVGK